MKSVRIIICLSVLLKLTSFAQEKSVKQITNGVIITTQGLNVKAQFYAPNILRIEKWSTAGTDKKKSLSVIMNQPQKIEVGNQKQDSSIVISSSRLKAIISLTNGEVKFSDTNDKEILEEDGCGMEPVLYGTDSSFNVRQDFNVTSDEGIYGLGADQHGYMNYRGDTVTLVQTNTNAITPFLVSAMNYGILWDNYSKTVFNDDGKKNMSLWSDVGDNIDYYFIAGDNMDSVIAGYRMITGRAPMYGKWAYGYWQSKEHYATREEVLEIARKYRELKMPIDNIVQDWDYWGGAKNWSGMFFDSTTYPHPKGMIDSLHDMHFHFMISIWPALGPNTMIYKDMEKHGFLYSPIGWGGFKYYDAYNPGANRLYWKYLKNGLLSKGVDALWIDSTEPDLINANNVGSTEYEMKRVGNNYLGTWARYLNAFSLAMTDDLYSTYRKEFADKRLYILTRSTYAGQQRNAATTWTGDIGADWKIYRDQISAGINHCMAGIPYYTFDIGAFVLGAYGGVFNRGGKDPAYQEFYARMFQFGAFSPIFRAHGSETPREIWEFGEFTEPMLEFDNLRYRLLPYIYSLAWEVTSQGYTMMRGLPMDFESDKTTYGIDNQFMFGPSIMVTPVTDWMYYRPPEQSVLIGPEYFKTNDGKAGILATYCSDSKHMIVTKQEVEPDININWYSTGRPSYVTDSSFSISWEGKLIPKETGKYQFHLRSYDRKRIILDGKQLPIVYTSVEQYTDTVALTAGTEYKFVLETENATPGAAHMELYWKTPSIFAKEQIHEDRPKAAKVYLPKCDGWFDFWTGKKYEGGRDVIADAPIGKIPLFVRTGSIIPMGPFMQYSTEKFADPIELRVYTGADANFTLYEDENDNYDYEKGIYSTIEFKWADSTHTLTIGKRQGKFPGMMRTRTFNIVVVSPNHGTGVDTTEKADKVVKYDGRKKTVALY
ncbi:MAG TPA: TIM-barrel domain-containing protein [Candidatus Acidoferrales bacterium]|nr:TIM-barrel domain-containing protein [Candidatus Acidoferrales bacterium]